MNNMINNATEKTDNVPNGITETMVKLAENAAKFTYAYNPSGEILPLYRVTGTE